MNLDVLLSTMHQNDWSIVEKSNIKTSAVIVNQCDLDDYEEKAYSFGTIKMISTLERGLSRSRNMALANSTADICVLCDDDIVFHDDYAEKIINAFTELPNADVIVFNIISKNTDKRAQEKLFKSIKRIPSYKSYSSVHIAFRRASIVDKNIYFDIDFGAGSGKYSFAEDSLFFSKLHNNGLKSYVYPAIIADLYTLSSTWFSGFNKKYFYDTGAFLAAAYPRTKYIIKWYYPMRLLKKSKLSFWDIIKCINMGIDGYALRKPYSEAK